MALKKDMDFPWVLETHLVDHCNLNCSGCAHFAPLVKDKFFTDIETFTIDFSRFRQFFQTIYEIRLMGGEPLLHPQIEKFISIARGLFPESKITIATNGIQLPGMPESFWSLCRDTRAMIKLTRYPVNLDIGHIRQMAFSAGVQIKISPTIRKFFAFLNLKGDSDPAVSFNHCQRMFRTPFLKEGKLYSCFFPAYVHYFNEFFNEAILISNADYILLSRDIQALDIMNFLSRPTPFCRWCIERRNYSPWGLSQKKIQEWSTSNSGRLSHWCNQRKFDLINLANQFRQQNHPGKRG